MTHVAKNVYESLTFFSLFQPKQNKSDLISAPFGFQHVQHLGFNKESQQFSASGMKDDLFRSFLERGGLGDMVKTDDVVEFAMKFINEKIGFKKVSEKNGTNVHI